MANMHDLQVFGDKPSDKLFHEDFINDAVKNIIKIEGYTKFNVEKLHINTESSFLSVMYNVKIKGEIKDDKKETSIIIKLKPNCVDDMFSETVSKNYRIEFFSYDTLLKIYGQIQDQSKISDHERFKTAKFYDESTSELIILEDLLNAGFMTFDKMEVLPLNAVKLIIKELAKFHGLSFVLQKQRPEYFNAEIKNIHSHITYDGFHEFYQRFYTNCMMNSIRDLDEDLKIKMKDKIPLFVERVFRLMADPTTMGSLCHGDCKAANFMVKYNDINEVTEVTMIDFQFLYYGCPVDDLTSFIFLETDKRFRKLHLTELKDLYYETMKKFVKHLDVDISEIYPRNVFETQFKERLDYGMLFAMTFLPMNHATGKDLPDLIKTKILDITINTVHPRCTRRVKELLDEFTTWGYI